MTVMEQVETEGCGCDAPHHLARLISVDEALSRIARHAHPIGGTDTLPLSKAAGRILAQPVRAAAPAPPFDNAAMDGYAVDTASFASEGPWTLAVASRVPAGAPATAGIADGTAARIFTGAPVPDGADAVIRQEDTRRTGDRISVDRHPHRGLNIRRAGGDMRPGQTILVAGTRLGPCESAACAAAGAGTVQVRRALRVAVLVTGREVRAAGSGRQEAEIWDVNTPMLCAALSAPFIDLFHVTQVADSRAAVARSLAAVAGAADLIVTTGGISVGEEDHVKPALSAQGAALHFSGVAIKPGKPISFGAVGTAHWLGLPGNPLSALVTWQIFGAALVRQLTGQGAPRAARRHVVTSEAIIRKPGRCEFRPASLTGYDSQGREVATFEKATHSGRVGRLPMSDGLLLLPPESDHLPAGALVEFLSFCDT